MTDVALSTVSVEDVNNENDVTTDLTNVMPSSIKHIKNVERPKRHVNLPLARVKHIMKLDPDINHATAGAIFLTAKATELFITLLTQEALSYTIQAKKKCVRRQDLDLAIANSDTFAFMEGALD